MCCPLAISAADGSNVGRTFPALRLWEACGWISQGVFAGATWRSRSPSRSCWRVPSSDRSPPRRRGSRPTGPCRSSGDRRARDRSGATGAGRRSAAPGGRPLGSAARAPSVGRGARDAPGPSREGEARRTCGPVHSAGGARDPAAGGHRAPATDRAGAGANDAAAPAHDRRVQLRGRVSQVRDEAWCLARMSAICSSIQSPGSREVTISFRPRARRSRASGDMTRAA